MKKITLAFLMTVASCGFVHATNNENTPNPERVKQQQENNLNQQKQAKQELEERISFLEAQIKEIRLKKVEFDVLQIKKAISGQWFGEDLPKFESTEEGKNLTELQMQLVQLNKQWNRKYSTNSDQSVGATFGMLPKNIRDKIMFDRGEGMVKEKKAPLTPEEINKEGFLTREQYEQLDQWQRPSAMRARTLKEAREIKKRGTVGKIWIDVSEPSEPRRSGMYNDVSSPSEGTKIEQMDRFWNKK